MEEKLFAQLTDGIEEMNAIRRGETEGNIVANTEPSAESAEAAPSNTESSLTAPVTGAASAPSTDQESDVMDPISPGYGGDIPPTRVFYGYGPEIVALFEKYAHITTPGSDLGNFIVDLKVLLTL